jgi:hypothetical protein
MLSSRLRDAFPRNDNRAREANLAPPSRGATLALSGRLRGAFPRNGSRAREANLAASPWAATLFQAGPVSRLEQGAKGGSNAPLWRPRAQYRTSQPCRPSMQTDRYVATRGARHGAHTEARVSRAAPPRCSRVTVGRASLRHAQ